MNLTKSLILIFACVVSLSACQSDDTSNEKSDIIRSVKTLEAKLNSARIPRYYPAILEPPELVPLSFEVGGRVASIDLRVGQRVEKGERLATIEPLNLDLQLRQVKASLLEAETAFENAELEAKRQEILFERGAGAEVARDQALAQAKQAKARLKQAQANVGILSESREDADLRAPFDGYINAVDVQDFASVKSGEPVITLYRKGDLQAKILVSSNVVESLELGNEVSVLAGKGKALTAQITEIGRRATSVSSFPVVVSLQNATEALRPGVAVEVRVDIASGEAPGLISLPVSALSTQLSGPFFGHPPNPAVVFVFKPLEGGVGVLQHRKIQIFAASGHKVLVGDGIEPGERIVTAGVPFVREGQKVRLLDSALGDFQIQSDEASQ